MLIQGSDSQSAIRIVFMGEKHNYWCKICEQCEILIYVSIYFGGNGKKGVREMFWMV